MHIVFLIHEHPSIIKNHGGIGSFVKTITLELIKKNVDVTVLGIGDKFESHDLIENGVRILYLPKSNWKYFSFINNFYRLNRSLNIINNSKKIDILETSELGFAFIKKIRSIKYVIRLHGGHHFFSKYENRSIQFWKGLQEKLSFSKSDALISVTDFTRKETNIYFSFDNKKCITIPYPIDIYLFNKLSSLDINFDIVFVGTICEKKGINELIRAFQFIKNNYQKSRLMIYGRDWFFNDGKSYVNYLKEIFTVKELSSVLFCGVVTQNQLPFIYSSARVCVFPSHIETQGLVALEAMACGKTVIFSEIGPGKETIDNYQTGILCNPHDPIDIAKKIEWVFKNKDKSDEIGENARKKILNFYSVETITSRNLDFYKSII